MTPAMEFSAIIKFYANHPGIDKFMRDRIQHDLETAMALGHKFGLERAADTIRELKVTKPKRLAAANIIEKDFL